MVQTRRKDDSSYSNSRYLRRSTREKVIRFEPSDKDDEDSEPAAMPSWSLKARRHRATIQYRSSRSNSLRSRGAPCADSDSDDESQSDESIFQRSRRTHLSQSARREARSRRLHSAEHAETSNDHIDMGLHEDVGQREDDGIRRSSRRRTHPPSWLVGDQTVRGYPSYNQSAKENTASEKGSSGRVNRSRDRLNTDLDLEEASPPNTHNLRHQRSVVKKDVKDEAEDEDEGEGESEPEKKENEEVKEKATEQDKENASTAEEEEAPKENSHRTKTRFVKERKFLDENFPDMYSRVKRVRRQTKRFSYPSNHSSQRKLTSGDEGLTSQTQSSSGSDDSDIEREERPRRRAVGQSPRRTYQLRVNKPAVDRFQPQHIPPRRPPRALQKALCNSVLRHLGRRGTSRFAPNSSSSSSDEQAQARYDHKKTHSRHLPLNYHPKDGVKAGGPQALHSKDGRPATLADIDPMALDRSIRFKDVGGLEEHIHCLQEMVVFPMLYKEIFEKFHITPPKGVLFHGPPGTGKTLVARALANECSQGDRKVSFFMRKGADCLCKWVGESERQLRLLFEQAYQKKPSIIFFDEIDGLAPVRSSKQDQIHASIVSTLLALMDGLDNRGDVIVIGATNRIDAIDPALRRPGRFDRELYFPLPACKERQEILRIHMTKWENKPADNVLSNLAEQSSGYCGSDLRALCTESVIQAVRRTYPQIYKSNKKLLLDANKVKVDCEDFYLARSSIIPAAHRVSPSPAHKLPSFLEPLLKSKVERIIAQLKDVFPHGLTRDKNILTPIHRPRFLIDGSSAEQAQTLHVAPALLHCMEHIPVYTIDLGIMYEVSARSPEETVCQVFQEARRNPPSIIYLPRLGQWWDLVPQTVQSVFLMQILKLDMHCPILLMATSDVKLEQVSAEVSNMFSVYRDEVFTMSNPSKKEREAFFYPLLLESTVIPPKSPQLTEDNWEELPEAPPPEPAKLTEEELEKLYDKEEHTLRELRIFLREVCAKLARNRLFFMFTKPVDVEEAPDYYDIIEKPMDLETMMTRIDQHHYVCAKEFLDDIDLICRNALEYNPDRDQADKLIRHRACFLRDSAYALIKAEMDTDFEDRCRAISADRKKRKDSPSRYAPAPDFIHTASSVIVKGQSANGSKEGPSRVNGDVSSHSSHTSNHGPPLNNSGSARKRKVNSWSRGCISKPKRKKQSEDSTLDKQDSNAGEPEVQTAGQSPPTSPANASRTSAEPSSRQNSDLKETPEETMDEKADFSKLNGSIDSFHSDVEMKSPESKGSLHRNSESPIRSESHEAEDVSKNRRMSSDSGHQKQVGKLTTSAPTEVSIDKKALEELLTQIVSSTEDCSVEKLTELYVRLEKKVSSFSSEWDRSPLLQALQDELQRFKRYLQSAH